MKVSIKQALEKVAAEPVLGEDEEWVQRPVHDLVCRNLFEIANKPDSGRGAAARANKARKMIFDRMVGKRRPGSHPATRTKTEINFIDLTSGELP